jgi:Xaa-Pro aminopeptidase
MSDAPSSQFVISVNSDEFSARREKLYDIIGEEAVAVLQGAPHEPGFRVFRQNNDFYYCCGVEIPHACLLLRGDSRTACLYLPSHGKGQSSEGALLGYEDADLLKEQTGLDEVFDIHLLSEHLADARIIYTTFGPQVNQGQTNWEVKHGNKLTANDPWDSIAGREQRFMALLKSRVPRAELRDLTPAIFAMRGVKSTREIELLRMAGKLSAQAVVEAMRATQPGIYEFQLGAIAHYLYRLYGARSEGYRPIIASGDNIWYSHYFQNNCILKDGDLVLMDFAPDYGYYTSDIGRMFPVNGTYSPLQRKLYGYIVEYHKTILSKLRPGVTADQVMEEAAQDMRPVVERTQFSKDIYKEAAQRTLDFRGHLSHPVGLAVHDVGNYRAKPLEPGVVITIDPQMWIPEEKKYIRVEDTIVITEDSYENFTIDAPLELDDVEALMKEDPVLPIPAPGLLNIAR